MLLLGIPPPRAALFGPDGGPLLLFLGGIGSTLKQVGGELNVRAAHRTTLGEGGPGDLAPEAR